MESKISETPEIPKLNIILKILFETPIFNGVQNNPVKHLFKSNNINVILTNYNIIFELNIFSTDYKFQSIKEELKELVERVKEYFTIGETLLATRYKTLATYTFFDEDITKRFYGKVNSNSILNKKEEAFIIKIGEKNKEVVLVETKMLRSRFYENTNNKTKKIEKLDDILDIEKNENVEKIDEEKERKRKQESQMKLDNHLKITVEELIFYEPRDLAISEILLKPIIYFNEKEKGFV